jgi:hypothetical protein
MTSARKVQDHSVALEKAGSVLFSEHSAWLSVSNLFVTKMGVALMVQKTTAKKWSFRGLAAVVAVGVVMTATALPASAARRNLSAFGTTPVGAVQNAVADCQKVGGTVVGGGPIVAVSGGYKATIICDY